MPELGSSRVGIHAVNSDHSVEFSVCNRNESLSLHRQSYMYDETRV